jgi:hypothetical protein
MANDNILGAPAQGFGQDVSFTFRPDNRSTPNLDGLGRATAARGGVLGSPVSGGVQQARPVISVDNRPDPTMTLLSKMAEGALKHKLQEKRAEAFVDGMQRAANGEAIADIAEGQPWYTTIFGESDVVEGARAYTTQAKTAELAGAIEDGMHELRKMDSSQAKSYYSDLLAKNMTGDPATDAALMQGFARTLPATMRRQAKEHYAFRQEEASAAESRAFLSAADLMQKRAQAGTQNDDEYAREWVSFIAGSRPAVGRDVESWQKARTQDMLNLAQAGKFHAVGALKASGFLDLLPADSRTKIESALDTAENRTVSNKLFEYAPMIGQIAGQAEVFSTDLDPTATAQQMRDLNARFRKETGIDRDLITMAQGAGIIKDAHVTLLREGERRLRESEQAAKEALKAGDKARADELTKLGALTQIGLGQAAAAKRALPDGVVDTQFHQAWMGAGSKGGRDAQAQLLMLNFGNEGYVNPAVRSFYETRTKVAGGNAMPAQFMELYADYQTQQAQHPALADAYFGSMSDRMAWFDSLLDKGKPVGSRGEAEAYMQAFGGDAPRAKSLDDKGRKALAQTIAGQHDSAAWKFWRQQRAPLRADQQAMAVDALDGIVGRHLSIPGRTMDQAVQLGFAHRSREEGDDMLGGFYIRGQRGQQPLLSVLKKHLPGDPTAGTGDDAPDVWDNALSGAIRQRAERAGVSYSDPISVIRMPDANGSAWLTVIYTGSDGRPLPVRLSSNDIKNYLRDPNGRIVGGQVK